LSSPIQTDSALSILQQIFTIMAHKLLFKIKQH
jgi:hypothetical protein